MVHKHHYDKGAKGKTFEVGERALVLFAKRTRKQIVNTMERAIRDHTGD